MPGGRFSSTDTPAAVDGVELALFDGEAVLFDPNSSMLHRLGAIAGGVWLWCDGTTDVATMLDELAAAFDLSAAELSRAVYQTLERFADEGLLVGHAPATSPPPEPSAGGGNDVLAVRPDP